MKHIAKVLFFLIAPGLCLSAELNPVRDEAIEIAVRGGLFSTSYQFTLFDDGSYFLHVDTFTPEEVANNSGIYTGKTDPAVFSRSIMYLSDKGFSNLPNFIVPNMEAGICEVWGTDARDIRVQVQSVSLNKVFHYYSGCDGYPEARDIFRGLVEILKVESFVYKN